ncbi:hypothetical protein Q8A67_010721 [Cirrhinus molitorella]|uniref:Uncharacterized protein n=1 Tax=Cirrhinus molitorella TaxID=172907 RepID=A0AA88PTQ0_9TELE|nr:hypothetical protein Q8A67_010721 [Cirrhinus molitorella]
MESDQLNPLSFPSSPERRGAVSPVEFSRGCLAPTPEARDLVSFGMEDILFTAASDSEDFGADSLDVLPPSGQEARPSPAYSELVDVLSRATEKLSLDWPDEPHESQSSKLNERFLSGSGSRPRPAPRKELAGRATDPVHPPPYTVWGSRGHPATCQRPRKRVDLKHPSKPPAAASSGHS